MKPSLQHIEYIRKAFSAMSTTDDLVALLNYALPIKYGQKVLPLQKKRVTYYAYDKFSGERYYSFEIKKKNGDARVINAPKETLLRIQRALNLILSSLFEPNNATYGFVSGRSIVNNAQLHSGNYYVYNIDLEDFFHSIDQARVWRCLQLKPYNLRKTKNNSEREKLAGLIANLCCTKIKTKRENSDGLLEETEKNVLPQGAPTSPIITNIVCQKLDFLLTGVGKRFGLRYSRYADDITFSSLHNVYQDGSEFTKELKRIIEQQGFRIKTSKVRLQNQAYRQEVTGLVVNQKPNIKRKHIKQTRSWLYLWERYGYEKAYQFFLNDYRKNIKQQPKQFEHAESNMATVLKGRIQYIRMVKGENDSTYTKLKNRLAKLLKNQVLKVDNNEGQLNQILELLLASGLESAMEFYKPLKNVKQ